MISLAEARAQIAKAISPLPTVTAPLHAAACHILREPIRASADIPPFDRATVDGYAVIANDPSKAFRVVTEIQPGAVSKRKIKPGECARIFTGAPVPASASQVIMQEDVRAADGLMEPLKRDEETNIHPRGADARRGDLLLAPGIRLGAGELSLLASLGRTQLKVSPRIRVAHLATGNELVSPEAKPRPGQIRDSNSILVATLMRQFGGELVAQQRVADDFDWLLSRVRRLKSAFDLLLVSGGASVGDYDYGRRLLGELRFKVHFTAINLRPGKPLVFATRGRQAAFILPGNPVSHLVTLQVAVRLAAERLAGAQPSWPVVNARLAERFEFKAGKRETFWPARVTAEPAGPVGGRLVVRARGWQSSGDVTGLTGVNGLIQLAAGTGAPRAGDEVPVFLLDVP